MAMSNKDILLICEKIESNLHDFIRFTKSTSDVHELAETKLWYLNQLIEHSQQIEHELNRKL